jgi:histone H3/H4
MKNALPDNAKIAKEAKECMQECVSEFISFITSEGESPGTKGIWEDVPSLTRLSQASEKCQQEKRKTVNGEDILFAMTSLGFENYAEALKVYLSKYREVRMRVPEGRRAEGHQDIDDFLAATKSEQQGARHGEPGLGWGEPL